jgi:RimJ/RimL family protein N-acetyltransferase
MYRRPLLPEGASPPETIRGDGFLMRPLRLADAEADYEAVMESERRLRGWMDPDDPWPEGLTLHENRIDLGWHEREFSLGHSFAWTVVEADGPRVLGCAYLYPSDRAGHAAMAFWWARESAADLDGAIGAVFREMLAGLPLAPIALPGREIGWEDWLAPPLA